MKYIQARKRVEGKVTDIYDVTSQGLYYYNSYCNIKSLGTL